VNGSPFVAKWRSSAATRGRCHDMLCLDIEGFLCLFRERFQLLAMSATSAETPFVGVAIVGASFAAFFIIFRALSFDQRISEMWGALCAIGLWSILFWAIAVNRQARSSSPALKREPFFGYGALEWGLFILSWVIVAAAVQYFRGG
jgi:hypothetical protein